MSCWVDSQHSLLWEQENHREHIKTCIERQQKSGTVVKGTAHQKIKNSVSIYSHPHVVFLSSEENKRRYFEECSQWKRKRQTHAQYYNNATVKICWKILATLAYILANINLPYKNCEWFSVSIICNQIYGFC